MLINCKVNLMYVNNPLSNTVPYLTKLTVDKSIKNLMITVSGLNSKLDVISSNGGKNHGASEKLTTDLDLKNVKIVSIKVSFFFFFHRKFFVKCEMLSSTSNFSHQHFILYFENVAKCLSFIICMNFQP